ncbi:MAG: hypothetical protein OHK0026_10260 [Rhodocyclaceae bacterium]
MAALTGQQTEHLRREMQRRHAQLMGEIHEALTETGEHPYVELSGEVADTGEQAAADLLIDVDNAMVDRDIEEVRDIEAAFARMEAGSYGVCIDCGQAIGYERLASYPSAKRCRPCQAVREKTYKHGETPSL